MRLLLALLCASALAVLAMRWWPPVTSSFMLQARAAAWLSGDFLFHLQYRWTGLRGISPNVQIAVIASEDQRFPFHWGFDLHSIQQALRTNAGGERLRGASTISQQTAKNLFLWSGRSYLRKLIEAWFTVLLETCWPKTRILEVYLNVAQFGPGVYGVGAASRHYFHKSPAGLTRSEAALLAAVLPDPNALHVQRPSAYLLQRRDWILGQMHALGESAYLKNLAPHRH